MKYMTASQAAEKWNVSQRRVQIMCAQNRIEGTFKLGEAWAIPEYAKKPKDKRKERRTLMKRYNVIDLFCGCGGFSKGFQQAGFDIRLGVDMWKDATITYKHNFPSAVVLNEDIVNISGEDILNKAGIQKDEVDVIIGGPPCQGFSVSGKRMIDDERNKLYKSFVELLYVLKPKVFVMENVPGLVRLFKGQIAEQVIKDFTSVGYKVQMKILSADNYGVPQQRKRVFFVGLNENVFKNKVVYEYPIPFMGVGTNVPAWTCKDAIGDLDFLPEDKLLGEKIPYKKEPTCQYQRDMRKDSEYVLNHSVTIHKEKTREIIALVPDGGNYKNLPEELQNTRKVHIAWTRMDSNKPCFTIDTGHNHHFHYKENRVPTVRESARIQSFPDNFEFIGIKTSQLKQVGNAVPPLLAEAVAKNIIAVLNEVK